jgi:hypothetical protein
MDPWCGEPRLSYRRDFSGGACQRPDVGRRQAARARRWSERKTTTRARGVVLCMDGEASNR